MKKLIILIISLLFLTGCNSDIELSDLKIEKAEELELYYIVGTINSKKDNPFCEIDVNFKNGDINYDYSFIELPDKGLSQIKVMITDDELDKITNLEDYEIKIKKIKCN